MILPDILANTHHQPTVNPLTVITSSSHSISLLPLIAEYVSLASVDRKTILVSALYDPRKLGFNPGVPGLVNIDLSSFIPGFMDEQDEERGRGGFQDVLQKIELAVDSLGRSPVTIIIDSPATLASNFGSTPLFLVLVQRLLSSLTKIEASQLILPLPPSSSLLAPLSSTTLYPTLNLLTLHPPPLFPFISQTYHLLPPPSDRSSSSSSSSSIQPASKFFNILSSLTDRHQADDPSCLPPDGSSGWSQGFVVELLIRSRKGRNGVGRYVEGIRRVDGPSVGSSGLSKARARSMRAVGWKTIEGLDVLLSRGEADLGGSDPSATAGAETKQSLPTSSFNLGLTDSQKQSRSTVPIPYAHEGERSDDDDDEGADPAESTGTGTGGIFYEPDEGDDMDEDDPDEDLEF
ncbi:hypothetical protein [Phaffia rhodozyma]|uniref:Elongator complex protein 5 n=1 Tax=Phaffia rhodozyma TaxID=264483 RepID=A0A0F7SKP5_PHARH|nr:hypothetical protein [Phaffia rhodozyma]